MLDFKSLTTELSHVSASFPEMFVVVANESEREKGREQLWSLKCLGGLIPGTHVSGVLW